MRRETTYSAALWLVAGLLASTGSAPAQSCEASGTCYYIDNQPGSGSGTYEDPWGMADLPDPDARDCENLSGSPAMSALAPGDVLYFRGGTYELHTCPEEHPEWGDQNVYWMGYIASPRPGTRERPITFRNYPGERVVLERVSGDQPTLGDRGNAYLRYLGFVVTNSFTRFHGDGVELAYSEIIGKYIDTGDNHDGIRIEGLRDGWFHHNIVRNVRGQDTNSSGFKMYDTRNVVVEDNYATNNNVGIRDKDSGIHNTFRRNLLVDNAMESFYGNNQDRVATYYICGNVVDQKINLMHLGRGSEVHDNLVVADELSVAWAGEVYDTEIWNNVVVAFAGIVAYDYAQESFNDSLLAYMDHNFYTSRPRYRFGRYADIEQDFSLAEMQSRGYERNSQVVYVEQLFSEPRDYEIAPEYASSGRYGDKPGPDDPAVVMDTTRYGPEALRGSKPATRTTEDRDGDGYALRDCDDENPEVHPDDPRLRLKGG